MAVFLPETNVAGVPVLILVGALAVYAGISGQQLIQVSKDGAQFGTRKLIRKVISRPDVSVAAKSDLLDAAEEDGVMVTRYRQALEFEQSALDELTSMSSTYSFQAIPTDPDENHDLLLKSVQVEVFVILKWGTVKPTHVRRWAEKDGNMQRATLVVSSGLISERIKSEAARSNIHLISWRPGQDFAEKVAPVLSQLGLVPARDSSPAHPN
ncbi:hypothetical protein [Arthrobacter sp. B1805]|uniref:hypothetical protein n=1 Tax=Arthrobacter sp. B1805 TaxID=2058892 RepID=UPI0011B082D8|nr:hypothetical protein [Arthrobacter sp. B1805]